VVVQALAVLLALLLAVGPAKAMEGLPSPARPAALTAAVSVSWRDVIANADAIGNRTPLTIDVSEAAGEILITSMVGEYDDMIAKFTARVTTLPSERGLGNVEKDACDETAMFFAEAEAGVLAINMALRKRIGAPTSGGDGWDNAGVALTPFSADWVRLEAADLRLVRLLGQLNLDFEQLRAVARPLLNCGDRMFVGFGSYEVTTLLVLGHLVWGDDRTLPVVQAAVERAKEEMVERAKEEVGEGAGEEADSERYRLSCTDMIKPTTGGWQAVAKNLVSLRGAAAWGEVEAVVALLDKIDAGTNWYTPLDGFSRFFPSATAFYANCADTSIPYDTLPRTVSAIDVEDSAIFRMDLRRQSVDFIELQRSRVDRDVVLEDLQARMYVTIEDTSVVGSLSAISAQVQAEFTLRRVVVGSHVSIDHTSAHRLLIEEITGPGAIEAAEGIAAKAAPNLTAIGAAVSNELRLTTVRGFGYVSLSRSSAAVVLVDDVQVPELFFRGLEADALYITNGEFTTILSGKHAKLGTLEISDTKMQEISATYMEVATAVQIWGSHVFDTASFYNLTADDFWMTCSTVEVAMNLESSQISQSIGLRQVRAGHIRMWGVRTADVSIHAFNDDAPRPGETSEAASAPGDGAETAAEPAPSPMSSEDTCKVASSVDRLNLRSLHAGAVEITGAINEVLNLNDAVAERVSLRGERLQFRDGAVLMARNARIGVFTLAPSGLAVDASNNAKMALDISGASIDLLKPHTPILDEGGPEDISMGADTDPLEEEDYRAFYLLAIPQALQRDISFESLDKPIGRGYDGAAYRLLRESATSQGYPAIARDIAVQQNDRYSREIPEDQVGLKAVYFLGQQINEYGYDNTRAVAWLVVLWVIGFLVLNFEFIAFFVLAAVDWLRGTFSPRLEMPKPWRPAVRPRANLRGIFFSMDRTVPTLGLDKDFDGTGGFVGWRGVCLYLQRICSFIVILFMIGGALNFFQ